jgi:hypothetical protein
LPVVEKNCGEIKGRIAAISHEGMTAAEEQLGHYQMLSSVSDFHMIGHEKLLGVVGQK